MNRPHLYFIIKKSHFPNNKQFNTTHEDDWLIVQSAEGFFSTISTRKYEE